MNKRHVITARVYDKKGNLLSQAQNMYTKSHPWQRELSIRAGLPEQKMYLHAEVLALLKVPYGKLPHLLEVARYGARGEPRIAFPCPACQIAIKMKGVKEVQFTSENGFETWVV